MFSLFDASKVVVNGFVILLIEEVHPTSDNHKERSINTSVNVNEEDGNTTS